MAIIIEDYKIQMDTKISLGSILQCENWITDGSILIDTDAIEVRSNKYTQLDIDDKKPIQEFIKKLTNEKFLNDILKEENEVFYGHYALGDVRLMYNDNISALIGEDYFMQLCRSELRIFFKDKSFYLFADLNDNYWDDDEHVKIVGVLAMCEAMHPKTIPHLLKLEKEYGGNSDNLRV